MVRSREQSDKITEYRDWRDNVEVALEMLKERLKSVERELKEKDERLKKAESLINLIYYEANPAYLTGLKIQYEKEYGEINEQKQTG